MPVDAPIVEKYLGAIVSVLLAGLAAVSSWAHRLSGRVDKVEELAAANASDIRHGAADVAELKDTVRRNHAESMRMHERTYDRVDTIARRAG